MHVFTQTLFVRRQIEIRGGVLDKEANDSNCRKPLNYVTFLAMSCLQVVGLYHYLERDLDLNGFFLPLLPFPFYLYICFILRFLFK